MRLPVECYPAAPIKLRALFAALLVASVLVSCSNRTELDPSVNELTLKTLSGNDITLSDSRGPTLVNFWSTTCVICIKEMPHLAELYKVLKPKGFQLIAVAMPYDPPNEVVELADQLQLPFPVALDINGEAVAAFGSVQGTPTSFLLDANGKLVKRYIGAIDLDKLEKRIVRLLGAS
jgi:thiol-disulfide isomerase/thioredoxin